MITLILLLVLGLAIVRVAWLGLKLIVLLAALAGCVITYVVLWLLGKQLEGRQAQESISVWANSMDEAFEMARNWDGEVVINVVDDEPPMKNITPLRRLLR